MALFFNGFYTYKFAQWEGWRISFLASFRVTLLSRLKNPNKSYCDISDDSESLCNDGGQRDDAYKPEPGTESVGGVVLPSLGILRGTSGPPPKYPSHDSSRLLGENSHLSQEIISSDTEQCGDVEIRPNTMEALQYDQWIKVFKTGGKDRKKRIRLLKKLALKDVDANNESLVLKGKNTEYSS